MPILVVFAILLALLMGVRDGIELGGIGAAIWVIGVAAISAIPIAFAVRLGTPMYLTDTALNRAEIWRMVAIACFAVTWRSFPIATVTVGSLLIMAASRSWIVPLLCAVALVAGSDPFYRFAILAPQIRGLFVISLVLTTALLVRHAVCRRAAMRSKE